MKKFLISLAGFLVVAAVGIYIFRGPLIAALEAPMTANMFITEDSDSFDPGLAVGAPFPAIRASYQGREITDIDQFIQDKGAIVVANRSADW